MAAPAPPSKFVAIEASVESLTPDAQLAFSNDKTALKKMRRGARGLALSSGLTLIFPELQELRKLVKEAKVESLGVRPQGTLCVSRPR